MQNVYRGLHADSRHRAFRFRPTKRPIMGGPGKELENARLADEEFGREKEKGKTDTLTAQIWPNFSLELVIRWERMEPSVCSGV